MALREQFQAASGDQARIHLQILITHQYQLPPFGCLLSQVLQPLQAQKQ
jgi:hypothetical protein